MNNGTKPGRKAPILTRVLALALAIGASHAPLAAQEDEPSISIEDFGADVLDRVREAAPGVSAEISDQDPFQINVSGLGELDDITLNLDRVYNFCLSAPKKECSAEVDQLVNLLTEQAEQPGFGPDNLRIVVRDKQYWDYVRQAVPEDAVPQHRQIGDDLYAILALDSPQSIALAPPEQIAEMGLSAGEAWDLALAQTAAIVPALPADDTDDLAAGMVIFEGDEYVASLMIDQDRWQAIADAVGPDLLVAPITDQFVVAMGALPEGRDLDGFRELVGEQCAAASRCVSPNVYRFREGRWVIAR